MPVSRRDFARTVGATLATATTLSGCLGFGLFGSASKDTTIQIDESGFSPKNVKIDKEAELSWENTGDEIHVVASGSDNWDFETELPPGNITYKKFFEEGVFTVIDKNNDAAEMKIAVGDATIEDKA